MISIAPKTDGKTTNGVHTALFSLKKIEKIKITPKISKKRLDLIDKFNNALIGNKNTIAPDKSSQALVWSK